MKERECAKNTTGLTDKSQLLTLVVDVRDDRVVPVGSREKGRGDVGNISLLPGSRLPQRVVALVPKHPRDRLRRLAGHVVGPSSPAKVPVGGWMSRECAMCKSQEESENGKARTGEKERQEGEQKKASRREFQIFCRE